MTKDDPSTQEGIDLESSTDDPAIHSDVLAAKLAALATMEDTPSESITEAEAAEIVTEHVEPARRALVKPDHDRTEALQELQAALVALQSALFGEEAETDSDGSEPRATVEVPVQVPRDVAHAAGARQR
ncbi:hypothetical protein GOC74_09970 [Halomicrobium mukohataei]|uniref:Uncharacterized protein n=1 Tax=Halomicrobium mukohataei TaxID=57705 RepID=A0A847UA49_9EURY|nr:hypothetical protein [Halomicrobium mukohataei]NLV10255.1 hypothetical protein [Halomicrobium mukohataei]